MCLDLDEQGRPVGLDIDRASAVLELERLETAGLPFKATAMSAQAEDGIIALADR